MISLKNKSKPPTYEPPSYASISNSIRTRPGIDARSAKTVSQLTITIDQTQLFYLPGDTISGRVYYTPSKTCQLTHLVVNLAGEQQTTNSDSWFALQSVYRHRMKLDRQIIVTSDSGMTYQKGTVYSFPFTVNIPLSLDDSTFIPPTFGAAPGAANNDSFPVSIFYFLNCAIKTNHAPNTVLSCTNPPTINILPVPYTQFPNYDPTKGLSPSARLRSHTTLAKTSLLTTRTFGELTLACAKPQLPYTLGGAVPLTLHMVYTPTTYPVSAPPRVSMVTVRLLAITDFHTSLETKPHTVTNQVRVVHRIQSPASAMHVGGQQQLQASQPQWREDGTMEIALDVSALDRVVPGFKSEVVEQSYELEIVVGLSGQGHLAPLRVPVIVIG